MSKESTNLKRIMQASKSVKEKLTSDEIEAITSGTVAKMLTNYSCSQWPEPFRAVVALVIAEMLTELTDNKEIMLAHLQVSEIMLGLKNGNQ